MTRRFSASLAPLLLITACNWFDDYRFVRVRVSGLSGSGLVVRLNDKIDTALSSNGESTLGFVRLGAQYDVAVKRHPTGPTQSCTVEEASGTIVDSSLLLTLTCEAFAPDGGFTLSGAITGTDAARSGALHSVSLLVTAVDGGPSWAIATSPETSWNFTLDGLARGTYQVTPTAATVALDGGVLSDAGVSFSPTSTTITIADESVSIGSFEVRSAASSLSSATGN